MFKRTPDPQDEPLEEAIDSVLQDMKGYHAESEEYAKCVNQLDKLYKLKPEKRERVKPDTALTVAGNLVGICLIVFHEKAHVITTKAFDRVKVIR
jgi:hypothetical protein